MMARKTWAFRDLKVNEQAIRDIPEVQDSPALRDALLALKHPSTLFFKVGCENSLNSRD